MALFNRTEIGLKDTSQTVTVPNDPKARLMYYLDCMCTVLKMDDNPNINRLRRYQNYHFLSHADTSVLLSLGILLKPDVLLNKCIFQNDSLCGDSGNKFYDLETVRHNMLIAGSVLIGGQNKQVSKIMTFKMSWLSNNWTNPMQILLERQSQEQEAAQRQQEREARQRQQKREARQRQEREARQRQEREARQRQEKEARQRQEREARQRQEREARQRRQWEREAERRQQRETELRRQKESGVCAIL